MVQVSFPAQKLWGYFTSSTPQPNFLKMWDMGTYVAYSTRLSSKQHWVRITPSNIAGRSVSICYILI